MLVLLYSYPRGVGHQLCTFTGRRNLIDDYTSIDNLFCLYTQCKPNDCRDSNYINSC